MPKKPDKPRGRRPATLAEKVGPEFIGKTPEADAKREVALRAHQQQMLAQHGEGLPYSRESYIAGFRHDQLTWIDKTLSMGRRLLVMRAFEPHGKWLVLLRDELNIEPRAAQRFMAAAARIGSLQIDAPARKLLESSGAQSKLFDLLSLDDQELEKIANHETEIDPDDIDQMTRSDLRRKLRTLREEYQARETVIERNAKRIDQLKEQNARIAREKPDEKARGMLIETGAAALAAAEQTAHLVKCCDALIQHTIAAGLDPTDLSSIDRHLQPLLEQIGELTQVLDLSGITGFVSALAAALPRSGT